jgi:hypothetical protein
MAKVDLAFQLTANASGMAAGVAKADKELSKVGASARATSAEFRQAAKITQELKTPAEKYADTVAKLDSFMQRGLVTQEIYNRALAKADAELKAATSSMEELGRRASLAERILNGTTGAIRGVGDATKSVADAGVSVIKFGKDVAWTYLQWKVFQAVRSPAGLKDFAIGALKATMAARTMILAAKALGIGLAIGGGAAGTAAAAILGLTNPLIGGALLTLNLSRAFLAAKERAFEMAAAITSGTKTVQQLNAELGKVQAQQIDNLAFAVEELDAAGQRSEKAFAGFSDVFVTPFIGAFAAIQSGLAGLTDGMSSTIEGITSIISPIAEVLQPIFTLVGTVVEGVMKLAGVLLDLFGVVLKVAGAFIRTLLSPVIVGWTNLVETIRAGMNAAFDFIGERIDWASKKIQDFYAFMAKVPVIGGAFAAGPEAANAAGAQAGPAAGAAEMSQEQLDLELQIYNARKANEEAIADASKKAADEKLATEMDIYQARKANEEALAAARKKEEQEQFDFQMQLFAAQRENEQKLRDAEAKRAEEAAKIQEKAVEKQAEIANVESERAAALGGKSNEALKANDIRSSEGMSQFLALATGREDPAIAEYRKQTMKLDELKAELRALNAQAVDILGAAA